MFRISKIKKSSPQKIVESYHILLDSEFPEFLKTGITLDPSTFHPAVMVKNRVLIFFGTPCSWQNILLGC